MKWRVVGKCSLCSGPVIEQIEWLPGTSPQLPHCSICGAKTLDGYGAVIAMDPETQRRPVLLTEERLNTIKSSQAQ